MIATPRSAPLVPKLCLGTQLSSKLCFAAWATELPGQVHSQTEFGNEEECCPNPKSKIA
jgi:hypothetical protein